jgi:pyruvate dehydrogenase E1 component alpha subunit
MIENKAATRDQFDAIWAELRAGIEAAIAFADESPYPTPDQIMVGVYTSMSGAK